MLITTKMAFMFKSVDGKTLTVKNDFTGNVPEWVKRTPIYALAVDSGDIVVHMEEDAKSQEETDKE